MWSEAHSQQLKVCSIPVYSWHLPEAFDGDGLVGNALMQPGLSMWQQTAFTRLHLILTSPVSSSILFNRDLTIPVIREYSGYISTQKASMVLHHFPFFIGLSSLHHLDKYLSYFLLIALVSVVKLHISLQSARCCHSPLRFIQFSVSVTASKFLPLS